MYSFLKYAPYEITTDQKSLIYNRKSLNRCHFCPQSGFSNILVDKKHGKRVKNSNGLSWNVQKGFKNPFLLRSMTPRESEKSTHPQPLRKKHPRIFTPSSTVLVEYFTTGSWGILFFRKGVKNLLHSRVNALHRGCFHNHL